MLNKFRNELDQIDNEILILLAKRFGVTEQIGKYKTENKLPARDIAREKAKLSAIGDLAEKNNLDSKIAKLIFKTIMRQVVINHKKLRENKNAKY